MCQAVLEIYSCNCKGVHVQQVCSNFPSKPCKYALENPSRVLLDHPCSNHRPRRSARPAKKNESSPPSAYYNIRRNPSQRTREKIDDDWPARNSARNNGRESSKTLNSRHPSVLSPNSACTTLDQAEAYRRLIGQPLRPLGRSNSIATQGCLYHETMAAQDGMLSCRSDSNRQGDDIYAVRAAKVRRSLEEYHRRCEDERNQNEHYQMFLDKDRRDIKQYRKKRSERKMRPRLGWVEDQKLKSDGICSVM